HSAAIHSCLSRLQESAGRPDFTVRSRSLSSDPPRCQVPLHCVFQLFDQQGVACLNSLSMPTERRVSVECRGFVLSFRTHLYIQQFDFPMEMAPFDLQIFCRTRDVPVMLAQLSSDILFFKRIAGVPERIIRLCKKWIDRGGSRLG